MTGVNWTLGSQSGTQVLDTTIAPQSSTTVSVDVGSPSFGQTYPFTVTSVVSGGQGSAPLSGHVSFLPVVERSLGSSWSLSDVEDGPSVDLGDWGAAGSAQAPGGPVGQGVVRLGFVGLVCDGGGYRRELLRAGDRVNIWQGDSLQVAVTSGVPGSSAVVSAASTGGHYEYGAALTSLGAQVYRLIAPAGVAIGPAADAPVSVTRDDAADTDVV